MITFLKGDIIEKNPSFIILDVNGVGYFIKISIYSSEELPNNGKIQIYTHLIIREDGHTLYGFQTTFEREIFLYLISVNGVGPNMALTALSCLCPSEIKRAIYENNTQILEKSKGIGKKTAQRIIIELKDKALFKDSSSHSSYEIPKKATEIRNQALSSLLNLGYSNEKKIEEFLIKIILKNPEIQLEELVKEALKNI